MNRWNFLNLSEKINVPVETIKFLNPCYRRDVIPDAGNRNHLFCLPIKFSLSLNWKIKYFRAPMIQPIIWIFLPLRAIQLEW